MRRWGAGRQGGAWEGRGGRDEQTRGRGAGKQVGGNVGRAGRDERQGGRGQSRGVGGGRESTAAKRFSVLTVLHVIGRLVNQVKLTFLGKSGSMHLYVISFITGHP